ncbi:hypothetical protein ACWIUD_10485 [Helicobacter sp. 23-1044]
MENNETNGQDSLDKQAKDIVRVLNLYENAKERNMQEQSKIIMAISSALFGLLLAIVDKDFLSKIPPISLKVVIASNAITLIFALFSYCTANKSMGIKQQNTLDGIQRPNCWACATKFLNFGYVFATYITILALSTIMWQIS